jgi:hypothetical protein
LEQDDGRRHRLWSEPGWARRRGTTRGSGGMRVDLPRGMPRFLDPFLAAAARLVFGRTADRPLRLP